MLGSLSLKQFEYFDAFLWFRKANNVDRLKDAVQTFKFSVVIESDAAMIYFDLGLTKFNEKVGSVEIV